MHVAPTGDTEVEVEYYTIEDAAIAFKARLANILYQIQLHSTWNLRQTIHSILTLSCIPYSVQTWSCIHRLFRSSCHFDVELYYLFFWLCCQEADGQNMYEGSNLLRWLYLALHPFAFCAHSCPVSHVCVCTRAIMQYSVSVGASGLAGERICVQHARSNTKKWLSDLLSPNSQTRCLSAEHANATSRTHLGNVVN